MIKAKNLGVSTTYKKNLLFGKSEKSWLNNSCSWETIHQIKNVHLNDLCTLWYIKHDRSLEVQLTFLYTLNEGLFYKLLNQDLLQDVIKISSGVLSDQSTFWPLSRSKSESFMHVLVRVLSLYQPGINDWINNFWIRCWCRMIKECFRCIYFKSTNISVAETTKILVFHINSS